MSVKANKRAEAVLLISGAQNSEVEIRIIEALREYSLKILDTQKIAMANRLILAIHLDIDPGHGDAISREMAKIAKELGMDSALEVL